MPVVLPYKVLQLLSSPQYDLWLGANNDCGRNGKISHGNLVRQFSESVDALADQLVQTGHDQTMKYEFVEREEVEIEDGI